jgi:hypothetical protein
MGGLYRILIGAPCNTETQLTFCTRKRYHPIMITQDITKELTRSAAEYPVVAMLGSPRFGKATLARMTFPDKPYSFLEAPDVRIAAEQQCKCPGLAFILFTY